LLRNTSMTTFSKPCTRNLNERRQNYNSRPQKVHNIFAPAEKVMQNDWPCDSRKAIRLTVAAWFHATRDPAINRSMTTIREVRLAEPLGSAAMRDCMQYSHSTARHVTAVQTTPFSTVKEHSDFAERKRVVSQAAAERVRLTTRRNAMPDGGPKFIVVVKRKCFHRPVTRAELLAKKQVN